MPLEKNIANDPMRNYLFSETNSNKTPCIFLSHRSLDKKVVRALANYIGKAGIDYYLDENDTELQKADAQGDDKKTVECIHDGIKYSSHVLCILSEKTIGSWWVPYEIGYGEKSDRNIASIKIKDLPYDAIPAYLRMRNCMQGLSDFNSYLQEVAAPYGGIFKKSPLNVQFELSSYDQQPYDTILENYEIQHPLYEIIDR